MNLSDLDAFAQWAKAWLLSNLKEGQRVQVVHKDRVGAAIVVSVGQEYATVKFGEEEDTFPILSLFPCDWA